MPLPSQTARSQNYRGRSFSSRRRRRNGRNPIVFGGGAILAVGALVGLLWMFGLIGRTKDHGAEKLNSVSDAGSALRDPGGVGDPIGLRPRVIEQGEPLSAQPNNTLASAAPTSDDEVEAARPPRNLLREGIEQARTGEGSSERSAVGLPGSGASTPSFTAPKDGGQILATNSGGEGLRADRYGTGASAAVAAKIAEADRLLQNNNPLEARRVLNAALHSSNISEADVDTLHTRLGQLNADLVFSPRIVEGDPMCEVYTIQSGDSLSKIASKRELAVYWKLIQRINNISDPNRIRVGQKIKLVRGPFHAVVDKSDYRLDIYHGAPNSPQDWVYIRSFDVGLGKDDGTPIGTFIVGRDAKTVNPSWVNPRDPTERYGKDDPRNPIGEYWIGLEGLGDAAGYVGYGIHGTIDPDSIGKQESMGCIRLRDEDIEQVYELLEEGISIVKIQR